jgi:hypothetical protein
MLNRVQPRASQTERCSHGVFGHSLQRRDPPPHCPQRAKRGSLYCELHRELAMQRVLALPRSAATGQATVSGQTQVAELDARWKTPSYLWVADDRRLDTRYLPQREKRQLALACSIWDEPVNFRQTVAEPIGAAPW